MKENNNVRYIFTEKINKNKILKNFNNYLLEKENEKNEIIKMEYEEKLSDILSKSFNKIKNIIDNCKYIEMCDGLWFDNFGNVRIDVYYNNNMKKTEFLTPCEYRKLKSLYHKEIYDEYNNTVQIFFAESITIY